MTTRRLLLPAVVLALSINSSSLQGQETEAATRQFAAAVGFQNQKLFDEAIGEWQTFLRKFPNDARARKARHYLGTCCLQEKDYENAIASFTQVIQSQGRFDLLDQSMLNLGIAWYGKAQKSERQADYSKAEQAFGRMLSQFNDSRFVARAYYYRAECLFQMNKTAEAAAGFASFVDRYPEHDLHADALYGLGTAFEESKQPEKAERAFRKFASSYPDHSLTTEVRMRRADILFAAGDYPDAEAVFGEIASDKSFPLADVAMLRQARCLYEVGKMNDAARTYWNVPRQFRKTKHYDAAILAGAKCYYLNEQYSLARSGLEKIVDRQAPEADEAGLWLARCHLKEGNPAKTLQVAAKSLRKIRDRKVKTELEFVRIDALYEIPSSRTEAVRLYERFASLNPDHELAAQARYMAALAAIDVKDYARADQLSDAFLIRHADSNLASDVLFISAESKLLQGEHAVAAKRYRSFLKAAPDHENAQQATVRMALAHLMAERPEQAVRELTPVVSGLSNQTIRAEAYSILGRSLAALDKLDSATEMLQRSVQLDKDSERRQQTVIALAEAFRKMGKDREADAELQEMLSSSPRSRYSTEAGFRLAESAYQAERYQEAIRLYTSVFDQEPEGEFAPHALYGIGWTLFNQGKFRDSSQVMTKLIQSFDVGEKVSAKGLYVRAMAAYQLDEFQSAVRDVESFLKTQPEGNDELDALYIRGLALSGLEKPREAVRTFQTILTRAADYEEADKVMYELAWTYKDLRETASAVKAFEKLAADWPESEMAAEALFLVGEAWYEDEEYPKAIEAYSKSSRSKGNSEVAEKSLHKLGWSLLKSGDTSGAVDAFQNQLKSYPEGPLAADAAFLAGECHFRNKDWAVALRAFESVADTDSTYAPLSMFRAGECSASLEDWRSSRSWHQKVLDQYPEFEMTPEARYGYAWALQNEGRLEEAIELFEQVTDETQTETAAKARFMIGECLFARKNHKEASRHFLKAAFTYNHKEWSAMAYFEAARCFEVLKDTEQAANCYRSLIEKYPQHDKVRDARRRLNALRL